MSDDSAHTVDGEVQDPPPQSPGPPKSYLGQREVSEFLRLLAEGKGRDLALRRMKTSYRRFRNTWVDDPEFREEVRSAQRSAAQELEENGHLKAMAAEGLGGLEAIWNRKDKGRELNEARAEKARDRAFQAEQRAIDRAHQLELARLRTAGAGKAGPNAAAVEIALKVASLFVPHVPQEKLTELAAEVGRMCAGPDAEPAPG